MTKKLSHSLKMTESYLVTPTLVDDAGARDTPVAKT